MLRALVMDYGGVLTDPGADGTGQPLVEVVRTARTRGLRTALLSNADGATGPARDWLADLFDVLVFSGEVGFGKPDERIYRLTAARLGLQPGECVFVDDLRGNVLAAVATGMVGVHHRSVAATLAELATLFELPLDG
ncbi:HAD-IA family hydrolase [Goodfellowiella coeruleoviolacea]|uniref:Haloacid dehalogenase superfamily, subfamily IA, variant 3 with third motif having DD or ED n=1 Tax=Goodfellowiella coeruleoviolacea TaxID=334858 RepID=A0AAE3GGS6_9PSEU|nr:HAD-IA family hydrolase [Goodfellowiella coeruleoviolacea]MCP2167971.1 haloacid dehalogenase superfamily, subfamily IA, variant 3 with third motif having DD or ED [Goodfellowiella coeruleoviolacea]